MHTLYNHNTYDTFVSALEKHGALSCHVIADFDKTLTTSTIPSLIAVLRNDPAYLGATYAQKAHELFDHYHPLEKDPTIPEEQKMALMHERYSKHFDLLVASWLSQDMIFAAMQSHTINLREGVTDFLSLLAQHNIPLIILSASGLGTLAIRKVLEDNECLYDNITIISNEYDRDETGKALAVKQPIIHSMNKDETALRQHPIFADVANRKNVVLLWDSPNDIKMIHGFVYETLLCVGFMGDNDPQKQKLYSQYYDILISNNGGVQDLTAMMKAHLMG